MKKPYPTLLPNVPFYRSNNKIGVQYLQKNNSTWPYFKPMFRFSTSQKLRKIVLMVFWDFQGVDNWNTGSKWVQWMELSTLTLTRNYSLIASKQFLVNTYFPCSSPRQSRTFIEKVPPHVCFSGNRRSRTREMDFFGSFFYM